MIADLQRWDLAVCSAMNRTSRIDAVGRLFALCSRLGDGVFWYCLLAAMPLLYGHDGMLASAVMAANGVVCTLLYRLLKGTTQRPRPCDVHAGFLRRVAPLDRFSFPSGHTLHAVGFTTIAVTYHPMLAWTLIPFAALVALSRPVLGLHYPSDVLAGATIGGTTAVCAIAAARAFGISPT